MASEIARWKKSRPHFEDSRWSTWLGPSASLVCLVHCFSLPLLGLIAPNLWSFSGVLYRLHELEILFLLASLELGVISLRSVGTSLGWIRTYFAFCLLGLGLAVIGYHTGVHALVIALSVSQFSVVTFKHLLRKKEEVPECCEGHIHT